MAILRSALWQTFYTATHPIWTRSDKTSTRLTRHSLPPGLAGSSSSCVCSIWFAPFSMCCSQAEVGDLLAGLDDGQLTAKQYCLLRSSYVSHIDFTGLSFDDAIREYLCEGGFRLPGEAQKIDRLLEVGRHCACPACPALPRLPCFLACWTLSLP